MFESKYSKFLTALLIIVIIAIIGLLAFLGYDLYQKYFITKNTSEYVDAFVQGAVDENTVNTNTSNTINNYSNTVETENPFEQIETTNSVISSGNQGTQGNTNKYQGFTVLGTIEIPKTNVKYPILKEMTKKSIEVAVAKMYGVDPNQVGNLTIAGHNYRNGLFFSNNKKLEVGDKIYITDNSGIRVAYTIYKKYETDENDTEYMTRDTNGAREISLSTCTDDSKRRIIILAKAD